MGTFFIQQSYQNSINGISSEIRNVMTAVDVAPQNKVTTALSYGRDAQVAISIFITDGNNSPLPILERGDQLSEETLKGLSSSAHEGKIVSRNGYMVGAVGIEGESQLLVISPNFKAGKDRIRSLATMALLLALIFFAMVVALRLIVARDIAREKSLIESQERLRNEAERRRLLLDFAGDASHELRTPLTVLKGYLELGRKSSSVLTNAETIERLLHETDRMEKTISQLLEVFEIESLPNEDFISVDFSKIISERIKVFKETNHKRSVSSEIDEGIILHANESLVERVIGNLLSNIYRHTPEDATVRILAKREIGRTLIEFDDAGPGIPHLRENRLFTRFDKSRSHESGGSGLGLSIINAAVSKLGGTMELSTSDLGGLKTRIIIPND